MRGLTLLVLALGMPALAVGATQERSVLAEAVPGLWELTGVPGASAPVRQCFADIALLGQFEHRARKCKRTVIDDTASTTLVQYACGPAEFGSSELHLITPRSLKISTQGISDNLPFNYVLQAHRVGDCAKAAPAPRH